MPVFPIDDHRIQLLVLLVQFLLSSVFFLLECDSLYDIVTVQCQRLAHWQRSTQRSDHAYNLSLMAYYHKFQ